MNRPNAADGKPVILIVDDTPVNLAVVVDSLENRGYRLLIAQGGMEGLQRAALVKPDLILLDVMMPGMDGFEVCRCLKSHADTADIPVIFMTALAETEHRIAGFKVGGVDYLAKPMQIDEVIARVGTHLNLRIMQRTLQAQNAQLQQHQEELERQVALRTAELSDSNRLLREEIEERLRVERTMKFIAQRGWMDGGKEAFLSALVRYLGQLLDVDYVVIGKLAADPSCAETVTLYVRGEVVPNMQYGLDNTPCGKVIAGERYCCAAAVQGQFPEAAMLADMQAESYVGMPLWDSTGKVIGLIAVVDGKPMDDTAAVLSVLQLVSISVAAELKRRQSEQALNESRQFLSRVIDTIADPVFVKDRQHRWILLNQAFCEFIGQPMETMLGKSDYDFFPAHEADLLRIKDEAVFTRCEESVNEEEITGPDGIVRTIVTKKTCYVDDTGHPFLVGTILDITERKQIENLRYQRERELRTLVDNLPTMVVRYDRKLCGVYANPVYLNAIGCTEADILGNQVGDAWRATNISAETYAAILAEVMHSGIKTEVTLEWIDGNGSLVSHAMKIVPEYGADGVVGSVLALGFDLSDRRRQQIIEENRQRVFEKMAHGDNLNGVLDQVALYVESSKSGGHCAILLLDEEKKYFQDVSAPSFPESCRADFEAQTLSEEGGQCYGWVAAARRGERVIMENMGQHSRQSLCQPFIHDIGAVACWSEPIFSSAQHLLGVVTLYVSQTGVPDEADFVQLVQASHLSAIAIERKRIEQKMYRQASYDQLTGLPNRRLFGNRLCEEIAKAERSCSSLTVLFIDLDRFKEVNDTLGHESGDDLLIGAAQRIRSCVRESDTVARLGGDEFVVILPKTDDVVPQDRIAQSIVEIMTQPFPLGDHNAYVSASIGISSYPQDADNAEALISCADQAMYAAKGMGRNCFSFFNHSMLEQSRQRLELISELRGALDAGQLEVYYQPIIEVASGRAVKAEALLRWHHPELGMVPPDRFIPIAEETDLIQEIGAWVFREAADTAKRWHTLHGQDGVGKISVNMSPRQFTKNSGVQSLIDYLHAGGIDPSYLVVEITEGLLLDDSSAITEKLELLRAAGMQLSLDDFGTGYSAMAYLKKFNIDYLKIDRSFVRDLETDPGDRAIAEAIVVMAHRLGLKVIAEGVETEGQRALLMAVGCEYVQGYLYAKPMPVEMFLEYVLGS